ncbi:MAG: AI-2E family transporter, partial [Archaeoglobi archaeon]|nr:AI-2E family transporter [Candidatus Mnemosynella sp.]
MILIFLVILAFLSYFLIPLLPSIVLGFVFAYVARPIKKWFEREYDRRVSAIIATAVVITPIALIFIFGIIEAINQFVWILNNLESFQNAIIELLRNIGAPEFIRDYIAMSLPDFIERFRGLLPSFADVERTKDLMI